MPVGQPIGRAMDLDQDLLENVIHVRVVLDPARDELPQVAPEFAEEKLA